MARAFAENGADVEVFSARLEGPADAPRVGLPPEIPVRVLSRGSFPGVLRRRFRNLDLRVDARAASRAAVIAAHAFRPTVLYERYALFADAGRRVRRARAVAWVLEVNAPRLWEAALFEGLEVDSSLAAAEASVLRSADRVVVVSAPLQRWVIARGVEPARVRLLPNGAPATLPRPDPDGPYRLGYAGTFKRWHRLPEGVPGLRRLAARVGPLALDLWGDGPERRALLEALAGVEEVRVTVHGWGTPEAIREALRSWHAAWVPAGGAWPPDPHRADRLADALGEPCPGRWFDPLKGAEARSAGVPLWDGGDRMPTKGPPAPTWRSNAAAAVADLPQWDGWSPPGGSGSRTAPAGVDGGAIS
jgi:glycosyltransferase involved in cell wall biosynthesis